MSYNLLDEHWIPVAGHEPVSLQAIFSDESLRHLGGGVETTGSRPEKIWRTMPLLPQITPGSFRIIWG